MTVIKLSMGSSVRLKEKQSKLPVGAIGEVVALDDDGGLKRVWVKFNSEPDVVAIYAKYLEIV